MHDTRRVLQRHAARIYYTLRRQLGGKWPRCISNSYATCRLFAEWSSILRFIPPAALTVITVAQSRKMFKYVCKLVQVTQLLVIHDYFRYCTCIHVMYTPRIRRQHVEEVRGGRGARNVCKLHLLVGDCIYMTYTTVAHAAISGHDGAKTFRPSSSANREGGSRIMNLASRRNTAVQLLQPGYLGKPGSQSANPSRNRR